MEDVTIIQKTDSNQNH